MKFLIASSASFLPHFSELGNELKKKHIDCKIAVEHPYLSFMGFLRKGRKKKDFRKLMNKFNPDFVISDSPSDFSLEAISANKPLLLLARGDFWLERKIFKKQMKKFSFQFLNFWLVNYMAEKCYKNSTMILPVCKYLQEKLSKDFPNKPIEVLHIGVNPIIWNDGKGMNLQHPCVGIIQKANIWDKTKEMLILNEILKKLPEVHFYWAGNGKFSDKIISSLGNNQNFHWLGTLEYPGKIKNFLSEIDIFAQFSGLDMTPLSILEASLMCKPVIATNIGGISETIENKKTGFLVEKGNYEQWIVSIQYLLANPEKSKIMGKHGREFIQENFGLDNMAKNLISFCKNLQ